VYNLIIMKPIPPKVIFVLLLLLLPLQNGFAEQINVGFYHYPPLMIEDQKIGIYHDIIHELGKLTHDTFKIQYYPYSRVALLFNKNELDMEPGVYPGWVKNHKVPGVFSLAFGKVIDAVIFRPGKRYPVKTPEDLSGKTVGMVRGYSYPNLQTLLKNGSIKRSHGENEQQLLAMLAAGRFNQILINKSAAQFYIAQVPEYAELEVGDALDIYPVSMRIHPSKKAVLSRLNEAILKLRESGKIEVIYNKYGVTMD
jgi:polar amino acid transport system substrate-binding protein